MFFSHTAGSLGIGHVTEGRAVAFVVSAITDLPTHPKISVLYAVKYTVQLCSFVSVLPF